MRTARVPKQSRKAWKEVRRSCFERDKFTCKRCGRKNKQGKRIVAHYVIPKPEGGRAVLENLLTLCRKCERSVEASETPLRTIKEITTSGDEDDSGLTLIERTEEVNDEGYHFRRPEWHRWVYGSGRK
jgi:5-methylcytosine-specific restriction endonuclease McrA